MPHRWSRRQVVQGAGVAGLGLLAGCGRLPGQAQAPVAKRIPRVGFLSGARLSWQAGFQEGLRDFGYVEGQNITVEYRFAEGRPDSLPEIAAELVSLPVEIIVATGEPAIRAAMATTSTIPILIASPDDPVAGGLVASLARPGGNLTGLTFLVSGLAGKRLSFLKEAAPHVARVAVLRDPALPGNLLEAQEVENAGRVLNVELHVIELRTPGDLDSIQEAATRGYVDGLLPLPNTFVVAQRTRILELAERAALPAIYPFPDYAVAGGLMAYGVNIAGVYRRLAYYVDKILKGASPADLPIEQPMRFEFVINLQTAQALGLTIPPHVLLQATEVIQ
jgi:putative tryptophan/tyrosine transport system substrate-binding protein